MTDPTFESGATEAECASQGAEHDKRPTRESGAELEKAFDHFNKALFGGDLPRCLITLRAGRRSYGFFCKNRFGSDTGQRTDEIALNPSCFRGRALDETLSTLVHEMVHLWQQHFGEPGRGRYHNRQWAGKMKELGLLPSDTGADGGKETGDRVSHYILPGGPFEKACAKLCDKGFAITWKELPPESEGKPPGPGGDKSGGNGKSGRRLKYVCPQCADPAWTSKALLACFKCSKESGALIEMIAEDGEAGSSPSPSEPETESENEVPS